MRGDNGSQRIVLIRCRAVGLQPDFEAGDFGAVLRTAPRFIELTGNAQSFSKTAVLDDAFELSAGLPSLS